VSDRDSRTGAGDDAPDGYGSFSDIDRIASPGSRLRILHEGDPRPDTVEVTSEFTRALEMVLARTPFTFVTGRAGTGKTTFIRWLKSRYEGNVVVVAPTGLAALTAGGQTIHSFFGFPPTAITQGSIHKRRDRAVYEHLDLLVIDEVSMVRADLMDGIARFMELNGPRPGQPFGGVPVLAVGDLLQLPPVVGEQEVREFLDVNFRSPYFYSATALEDIKPVAIELTRVFRQEDEDFLEILSQIREGPGCDDAIDRLNRMCLAPDFDDEDWTTLVPRRDRAHAINERRLTGLGTPIQEFVGTISGRFLSGKKPENLSEDQLEKQLPSPYRLRVAVGARVMFTRNHPAGRWVNGTSGIVRDICEEGIRVEVRDGDSVITHAVKPTEWDRYRYKYDRKENSLEPKAIGSYIQFPLALAWAMTIHKAQGQTLERAIVDLGRSTFVTGQAYVALSRCRSADDLRLRRAIRPGDVKSDDRIRRADAAIRAAAARRRCEDEAPERAPMLKVTLPSERSRRDKRPA